MGELLHCWAQGWFGQASAVDMVVVVWASYCSRQGGGGGMDEVEGNECRFFTPPLLMRYPGQRQNPCLVPVLKVYSDLEDTRLVLALSCHLQTNCPQIESVSVLVLIPLLLNYAHVSGWLRWFRNNERGQARIVCNIKFSEVNVGAAILWRRLWHCELSWVVRRLQL